MEGAPIPILDLRSSAHEQGIELAEGTLLYTIVPRIDVGSSGPYFTEPGRALYWGFHAMLAARRFLPANQMLGTAEQNNWNIGSVATNWLFPNDEMVLLEIKTNSKIIFSNQMLDANPYSYVHYRYGSHDPLSTPVQVNLDDKNISLVIKSTCKEHSWSQPVIQRIFYYGLLAMIPIDVFKSATGVATWIAKDQLGRVDVNQSLGNLYGQLARSGPNTESYHEYIVETGIRICRPAEVIRERSYFTVNWEMAWLSFIGFLSQAAPSGNIKDYFIKNVMQLIVPVRKPLPNSFRHLDRLVLARIMSWCENICDAVALCSLNQRMRKDICPLPLVQQILRNKFLPAMNTFFAVLPSKDLDEREDLLGIPTKSSGHRWWKTGCVLFAEDFVETGVELHLGARSTVRSTAISVNQDPTKPLSKTQLHMLARFGNADAAFDQLELQPHEIAPMVRACNSFVACFSMLYSMNNYETTPRGCQMSIHLNDSAGRLDFVVKVMASMPSETVRSSNNPLELLSARPSASYREAVRRIGVSGSWLHDIGTPYFFLDPLLRTRLDKAKAFELQRYDIVSFMNDPTKRGQLSRDHLNISRMFLTNDLLFYKDSNLKLVPAQEPLVALVRCSLRGGYQLMGKKGTRQQHVLDVTQEDHVMIFIGGLSAEAIVRLSNPVLHNCYRVHGYHVYEYAVFEVDPATSLARSSIDGRRVTDIFQTNVVGIEIGLRKNSSVDESYYAAYMAVCCIIRLIIRDGCNRVHWQTNF